MKRGKQIKNKEERGKGKREGEEEGEEEGEGEEVCFRPENKNKKKIQRQEPLKSLTNLYYTLLTFFNRVRHNTITQ